MKSTSPFSFLKRPAVVGALVFSALLLLTQLISYQDYLLFKSAIVRQETGAADLAREKLQKALANSLSATQTLSFIEKQYGIKGDFEAVGKQILESNSYVDAIELLKGGVITNVYPLKGNESVIGYDILSDTARRIEALKAIEKRDLFFAGPFTLKQGGVSIVGRLPIFKDDKFWGFAVTLVKLSTLIEATGIDTNSTEYIYQLAKINPETHKEEFFLPNPQLFRKNHAVYMDVPLGEWRIYVMPRHSRAWLSFLPYSMLGILLSFVGGLFAYYLTMQPVELKKLVNEQSVAIRKNEENYRNTLNRVSDAFASMDTNWVISYMNQKAGEIFKCDPAQVIGKNVWEEFQITSDRPLYLTFHKAMAEQKNIYEERYIERLGAWFEIFVYPSLTGLSAFFRDISDRKKADDKIAHEKNLSDAIINSLPGIFYLFNKEGKNLRWNTNFEIISGYTEEEIGNMHPTDFFDHEEKSLLQERIAQVFKTGSADVEGHLVTKSGFKIPYYFNGFMAYFEGQQCVIGMGIDITNRKRAEAKVEHEKNLSNAIINSLPGVFYLYNKEGRFLRWNKNFETISGYTGDEVKTMHPLDFFDEAEKKLVESRIQEVFATGMSDVEANFFTKTGEKIPYYFNGCVATFEGEECLIGMGIDITNRRKAEQDIRESEEKYRHLFNNNPALIFIWCLEDHHIMEVNQTALNEYGYTRNEMLKMTVLDLRPAEDHEKIRKFAADMLGSTTLQVRGTWRHVKKSGELMMMDITSHRIIYNGREAILSIAENVTQKLLIEAQLKKSYEDIRLLNTHLQTIREEERAGIAREIHDELGQQLTALKMDVSWINKKIHTENPEVEERIGGMLSLIDQTVKVVRRIASDLRPGILDDLGLIAALEWQLGEFEKRMGIKTAFHAQITHLDLEKKTTIGLYRIFQEALTNIARHSGATQIEVSVEQIDNMFCLTIKDNGKGFDINEIKDKNTLGLLGMTERVHMLNGKLAFESSPGSGTSVIIKVPVGVFV